tara:strand:- start:1204 stop:1320 length:117 start_codon:yes stop_codon:yes gene_type:complete
MRRMSVPFTIKIYWNLEAFYKDYGVEYDRESVQMMLKL